VKGLDELVQGVLSFVTVALQINLNGPDEVIVTVCWLVVNAAPLVSLYHVKLADGLLVAVQL
jgi:hypothetical protein